MTTGQSVHEWGIFIFSKGVCSFFKKKSYLFVCLFILESVCVAVLPACISVCLHRGQKWELGPLILEL